MLLAFFLSLAPAYAQELPSCATPKQAADTLLTLLQPESYDPAGAASCLDLPPDQAEDGPMLAVQLKKVMDARGYYVAVNELPDEPEPEDEAGEKLDTIIPVDRFPVATIERGADGQWRWSQATLQSVPGLYAQTFQGLGSWVQSKLPGWFTTTNLAGWSPWQAVYFLLLLAIAGVLSLSANLLLQDRVRGLFKRVGLAFPQEAFDRTRGPLRLAFVGGVFTWGLPEAQMGIQASVAALFIARVILSVGMVLLAVRWIEVASKVFLERASSTQSRLDDQIVPLLTRLAKVVVAALGVVFVLHNVGVDVGSIIAGLGIGGIALALGAQQTIANLFGGVTLFLDRPFHIGDWVIVDGKIEGTVEEIGFRSTRIRTFETSLITVPNQLVATTRIDNMGERRFRRLKFTVGLTYDTPAALVQAMVEGIRAILAAHPQVRQDAYEVHFRAMSASSLDILVYGFLDVPGWHEELVARSEVLLQIKLLAEQLGVDFAFPTQSVWLEKGADRKVPDDIAAIIDSFGPEGSRSRQDFAITDGWNPGTNTDRGSESA